MNRQEFHDEVESNPDYLSWHNSHELADKLFDEVGRDTTCNGCRFKPQQNGTYPETCSECCRWFGDKYEEIVK